VDDAASRPLAPEFVRLVRDALAHLYDPVYLQTHPLAGALVGPADRKSVV
jgi:hypothetical protein